jgi:hypothetical protein
VFACCKKQTLSFLVNDGAGSSRKRLQDVCRELSQFGTLSFGQRYVTGDRVALKAFDRVGQSAVRRIHVRIVDLVNVSG